MSDRGLSGGVPPLCHDLHEQASLTTLNVSLSEKIKTRWQSNRDFCLLFPLDYARRSSILLLFERLSDISRIKSKAWKNGSKVTSKFYRTGWLACTVPRRFVCSLTLGLEELTTTLCARAAPGFLAEGIIGTTGRGAWLMEDPDYTFLALTRFAEGVKLFWGKVFGQVLTSADAF